MASAVSLRAATADDVPTLLAVIKRAFAEHQGVVDPPSSAAHKTPAILAAELAAGGGLVAVCADQVVGCVLFQPKLDSLYLFRLAVLPEWRGRGIAQALIAAVEATAKAQGFTQVMLSVRLALSRQRQLYARLGYREVGLGTHAGYAAPTFAKLVKTLA